MIARILRTLGIASLVALGCEAQQAAISGPVSGYVFDRAAHALRPILGLPGASLLGDPISFGFDVKAAFIAPRQDAAFTVASDGTFHLFRLSAGTVAERTFDGIGAAPDRVVFSPSGTAAALYAGGSIAVVKGLPDAPVIAGGVDLTSGTALDAMAVSDDGLVLLVSAGNSVRMYGSFTDMGKLMDTGASVLLAFAAGTHDAAVADPSGAGVMLFRDVTGANGSQLLAAPDDAIGGASGVAFSADGNTLLLASSAGQSVISFDLAAGARNAIACNCAPQSLSRMGNVYRLNELGADPLWLLDAGATQPRIVFVPALAQ